MVVDRKHRGLIQQQPLPQLQVKKGSLNYLIVIKRRRIAITWSTTIHMVSTIFILYPILLCCYQTCAARDTIRQNDPISDGDGETLLSAGKTFELGFFTPDGSSSHQRYVGIWYYRLEPKTVVWVANRNDPLPDSTGVLSIQDGNLVLNSNGRGRPFWSTPLQKSSSTEKVAQLIDSGNLVLKNDQLPTSLWQSFGNATDTFLPGMKMDGNLVLTSWKSSSDPGSGNFTFRKDQVAQNRYIIQNGPNTYWKSGISDDFITSGWDHKMYSELSKMLSNSSINSSQPTTSFYYRRLVMKFSGQIEYLQIRNQTGSWYSLLKEPKDRCDGNNPCGSFGSCSTRNRILCRCLPGFQPNFPAKWNGGDFSGGCRRISPLCSKNDTFLRLEMMRVKKSDTQFNSTTNEKECENYCNRDCNNCQAYAYVEAETRADTAICMIWEENLNDIQEAYLDGGHDLYVRVAISDTGKLLFQCVLNATLN